MLVWVNVHRVIFSHTKSEPIDKRRCMIVRAGIVSGRTSFGIVSGSA